MGLANRIAIAYHDRARTRYSAWNELGQCIARGEYADLARLLEEQKASRGKRGRKVKVPIYEDDAMSAAGLSIRGPRSTESGE